MIIYAIIVTYNAMHRNWIDKCLQSLAESAIPVVPIVIDNLSTDGTRDYVPTHYPGVIWMPQEKNLGFGQANNLGIAYALEHDADFVLLLNQDATLAPDAIEKMLAASDGESLLSPLHLNGDGTRIDEMFRYSLRHSKNLLYDDLLIRRNLAPCYESGEICAACWFMPIALIKNIGGFNPMFYHYGEDNNYFHRMTFHGVKTLLVPDTFMYHDRQLQGNIQVFNHKRLRRDLLLEACNINHSFFTSSVQWAKRLLECYTKDLPNHQYRFGAFFLEMVWLATNFRTISKSRKQDRQKGPNWL